MGDSKPAGHAESAAASDAAGKEKDLDTAKYKEKDYAGAVHHYTDGINLSPSAATLIALYLNRAAAYLMLQQCVLRCWFNADVFLG